MHLEGGKKVLARGLVVDLPEGTIAETLAAVQSQFKDVDIGSYPQMRELVSVFQWLFVEPTQGN